MKYFRDRLIGDLPIVYKGQTSARPSLVITTLDKIPDPIYEVRSVLGIMFYLPAYMRFLRSARTQWYTEGRDYEAVYD